MVEKSQLFIGFALGAALTALAAFALFSPPRLSGETDRSTTSTESIATDIESTDSAHVPAARDNPCEELSRLSDQIPVQERALTIPREFIFSSPGGLQVGDRVDLTLRFSGTFPFFHLDEGRQLSPSDRVLVLLLQNLQVLHWSPTEGLTISVTTDEAELVLLYFGQAEWIVSLRHPDDQKWQPVERSIRSERMKDLDPVYLRDFRVQRDQMTNETQAVADSDPGLASPTSAEPGDGDEAQESHRDKQPPCREDSPSGERIPQGFRAFQIPDQHLLTIPGDIHPGDRIDLLARFSSEQLAVYFPERFDRLHPDEQGIVTVLQNLTVVDSDSQEGLTLALTIDEMDFLLFLLGEVGFAVSLRNRASTDSYDMHVQLLGVQFMPITPRVERVERRPR